MSLEQVLDNKLAKEWLSKSSVLSDLIVQAQNITKIEKLDEYTSLRRIDLSFNPLTSLTGLAQLSQLRHLLAYSCRITNIDDLSSLPHLETLKLQQNGISKLISAFTNMKKLRDLRLDRNKLQTVDYLHQCSSLRVLDLSWNNLKTLDGIAGLQSLQELKNLLNYLGNIKINVRKK